jgi:hypothetical protein
MPKVDQGKRPEVLLVNYDIVGKHRDELDMLAPWDVLVCDEAHYLKNPTTLRTRSLLGNTLEEPPAGYEIPSPGALRSRRVWFLSGSPVLNEPVELFPLLRTLDPFGNALPALSSFTDFRERYSRKAKGKWGVTYFGAKKYKRTAWISQKRRSAADVAANQTGGPERFA